MQAGKQAEKLKHAIEIDEDKDINIKIIIVKANPRNQIIMVTVLPNRGSAKIKSVLSGDTVILLGRAAVPGGMAPEVTFTFERVTAPRLASKSNNNVDDPGAFSSREWLRNLCVGKTVTFETR
jgi:endonuclease YncB( thermonuclease family)